MITTIIFPPFCCPCCGFTNTDMFVEWLGGRTPTQAEEVQYLAAVQSFRQTKQAKEMLREAEVRYAFSRAAHDKSARKRRREGRA